MKLSLLLLSSIVATSNAMDVPQRDPSSSQTDQQLSEQPVAHLNNPEAISPDHTLMDHTTLLNKAATHMMEVVWKEQQDTLLRRLEAHEDPTAIQNTLISTLTDKLTQLATICKLENTESVNIADVINQAAHLKSRGLMERAEEVYSQKKIGSQSTLSSEIETSQTSENASSPSEVITTGTQSVEVNIPNYDKIISDAADKFANLFLEKNTEILVAQLEKNDEATASSSQPSASNLENQIEVVTKDVLSQAITQLNSQEVKKVEIQDKIEREARRIRQQIIGHAQEIQKKRKVERELNRIVDQIAAEYERVAPKVKREAERIGNQIAAEYDRVAPKVEREAERVGKQVENLGKDIGKKLGLRKKRNK